MHTFAYMGFHLAAISNIMWGIKVSRTRCCLLHMCIY